MQMLTLYTSHARTGSTPSGRSAPPGVSPCREWPGWAFSACTRWKRFPRCGKPQDPVSEFFVRRRSQWGFEALQRTQVLLVEPAGFLEGAFLDGVASILASVQLLLAPVLRPTSAEPMS